MGSEYYAQRFPELTDFLAGYFHQDWSFLLQSQDWRKVVQQYCADHSTAIRSAAQRELDVLVDQALSEVELRAMLHSVGAAYYPPGDGLTYGVWLQQLRRELAACMG